MKAGSDMDEVELRVVELLDQVITDCRLVYYKIVTATVMIDVVSTSLLIIT